MCLISIMVCDSTSITVCQSSSAPVASLTLVISLHALHTHEFNSSALTCTHRIFSLLLYIIDPLLYESHARFHGRDFVCQSAHHHRKHLPLRELIYAAHRELMGSPNHRSQSRLVMKCQTWNENGRNSSSEREDHLPLLCVTRLEIFNSTSAEIKSSQTGK